jgi:hypothetical protein
MAFTFLTIIEAKIKSPNADVRVLTAKEALALSALLSDQPDNSQLVSGVLRDLAFERLEEAGANNKELESLMLQVGVLLLQQVEDE